MFLPWRTFKCTDTSFPWAASLGAHAFTQQFLETLGEPTSNISAPSHRATLLYTGATAAHKGAAKFAGFAAAKAGLFGLTKTLAKECAATLAKQGKLGDDALGVTVNAVTPGFIETDMIATVPEKVVDKIRQQIPVGRLGKPEEIARVVHFLCADASSYITGQVWAVNGGLYV